MSLSNIFDVAGSGMTAQTIRLNTISSNIANAESVSSSTGETYRARHPVFSVIKAQFDDFDFSNQGDAGSGVRVDAIVESQSPLRQQYQPDHPMANKEGFVFYPNVNVVEEMADMISASRSFETNIEMMNTAKQLTQRILTLGQ
ncbi:MAG: flagellar basal body rod protein FlgC [Pseudomonadales bacterium]|nr:flagellar basal body rod protein FlgC [Pseudomonadales bacterium]MCP5214318.1 flagellar basal body rod protein FlgC [Pseudomonadales bacterium]